MKELLAFEWRYQTSQAAFVAAAALFFLLGFGIAASGFGPGNVQVTSAFLVSESIAFVSLFGGFAAAVFASNAVLRDSEYGMEEIVFSTPVGRVPWVVARLGGASAAALTAMALAVPGMMLATRAPWLDPERVGALSPSVYLTAFLVFGVPNVLVITALLFFVAVLTRSSVATYVAATVAYILYFVGAALTDSPMMAGSTPGAAGGTAAALFDPYGLSSFFEQTRYWTIAEKNSRALPLRGVIALNRLTWLVVAAALGALLSRLFAFRVTRGTDARRSKETAPSGPGVSIPYRPVAAHDRSPSTRAAAFLSTARLESALLLRSRPMLLLLLAWGGLAVTEVISTLTGVEYGSLYYPTSAIVTRAIQIPLSIIGTFLLVYFGAEVFWREERARFASVAESTPAGGMEIVAAKCSALALMLLALVATGLLAGVAVQFARGSTAIDAGVLLAFVYFAALPLILHVPVFALVHMLTPSKHLGMLLSLLVVLSSRLAGWLGLDNRLWRFGSVPDVAYSELSGYGPAAATFHWFALHWSLVAMAAALAAALLWRRGGRTLRERLRISFLSRGPRLAMVGALWAIALSGSWIYYNTDVLNVNQSQEELDDWKAQYEKKWRGIASMPQPRVSEVDVAFDLQPEIRRARLHGRYALVNASGRPLRTFFVSVRRDARDVALRVAQGRLAASDRVFGMHRFELAQALAPGESTTLHFDLTLASRGFEDGSDDFLTLGDASMLFAFRLLPAIGYRAAYELGDARERRRRGLPTREERDEAHGVEDGPDDWVRLTTTVSTPPDQIAVAPGDLEREWVERGRRYFRFRTGPLVLNRFGVAAARYEIARRRHGGIDLELYHHRGHDVNVERMLDAAAASLDLFQERFGAYPHRQLRLAEVPAHAPFGGFALPGLVFLNENRAFMIDARDPRRVDLVTRRVAHEVAHQWFGARISPANRSGAPAIVESLTKHAELLVIEKSSGAAGVRQLLEFENDGYLAGRSGETREEAPLSEVRGQSWVYYAKGAIVLNGIRRLIGDPAMKAALQRFDREQGGPGHAATSADLLAVLQAEALPDQRPLIAEWMTKIVTYDFAIQSAAVQQRSDGRFDVRLRISGAKAQADPSGVERTVAFRESIEVALFGDDPEAAPLLVRPVELRNGVNELTLTIDRRPRAVSVDPNVTRIDTARLDNTKVL